MACLVEVPTGNHFTIDNIPFGVFSKDDNNDLRVGSAIGDYVIDLFEAANLGVFDKSLMRDKARLIFNSGSLNIFMALGKPYWRDARKDIQRLLTDELGPLQAHRERIIIPMSHVVMHMPFVVGDYTDFYSSKEHATNVGIMFRGKDNALQPNWLHLPVGYHGRSSSILPSGTPIIRPCGQIKALDRPPTLSPTKKLDYELEMVFSHSRLGRTC